MKLFTCLFALAVSAILASVNAQASEMSKDPVIKSQYLDIFKSRVETAQVDAQHQEREVAHRERLLSNALKANEVRPGVFSVWVVNGREIAVKEAKAELNAANARTLEANNLLELVEAALAIGIEIPISFQFRP